MFSYDMVQNAAEQLKGVAVRTPLIESPLLNERVGGRVFLKCENLQHTGSFKFRGAYNRLSRLSDDEKAAGVLAFSSGNHAQGIARAAQMLGIKATIIMPADAPQLKVDGTRGYGAEVVFYDRYNEDREEVAKRVAGDSGAVIVPPYNNEYIMAGQGTVGLEIAEDLKALGTTPDQVLVNCGGGGLCSGTFTSLYKAFPSLDGYAVEPNEFDDVMRSLESGEIQTVDFGARSICDALLTPSAGSLTFPVLKSLGIKGLTVTDDEAKAAVGYAARTLKIVGEPGGVVSLAAVLAGKLDAKDKTTVCVISGGNIDPAMLIECLAH
ncbi:threonine/serine dehydratase [Kordiimonas sp. SCSIO 12603]|uniref:threonine ammonia-lyase n=1 Tax=Kordiimonas sp. SCSIO 12603 TaxID=2829596 RepID=UPI0021031F94|nr:threonine/serine dehydratase [Kordiimonas sp. SCSIO 12603]UTW57665.1 threonine/serine dehydratase [Kordiimonas sp. SCSIO 12603]